jgi:hypothetical protein
MVRSALDARLLRQCADIYWQRAFSELTLDDPRRMGAVAFFVLKVVLPILSNSSDFEVMKNPCDPVEQQQRQDFLDWLYDCSKRYEEGNHRYTGLFQEYLRAEAARMNEEPAV